MTDRPVFPAPAALIGTRSELAQPPHDLAADVVRPARTDNTDAVIDAEVRVVDHRREPVPQRGVEGALSRGLAGRYGEAVQSPEADGLTRAPMPEKVAASTAGSRGLWTDAERDTLVRLLTGDEPCRDAESLLAEYTRDTGFTRAPGGVAGELRKLVKSRAGFVVDKAIFKGLYALADKQTALARSGGKPGTVGAPDVPARGGTGWQGWEEKALIEASRVCTTAEAAFGMLAEKGSHRTASAYAGHLRRMLAAEGAVDDADRPGVETLTSLFQKVASRDGSAKAALRRAVPAPTVLTAGDDVALGDRRGSVIAAGSAPAVGQVVATDGPPDTVVAVHIEGSVHTALDEGSMAPFLCPSCKALRVLGAEFCPHCGLRYACVPTDLATPLPDDMTPEDTGAVRVVDEPRAVSPEQPAVQPPVASEARPTIPAPSAAPPAGRWRDARIDAVLSLADDGILAADEALRAIRRAMSTRND